MNTPNIESSESVARFAMLETAKKVTFEFRINVNEKNRFLELIELLSAVEFKVDVDLNNIAIKEYADDRFVFRIKASGIVADLKRWNDNLCCVSDFLNGNYGITHFKNIVEQKV